MNGVAAVRTGSFSTGARETKFPSVQPIRTKSFTPVSVFDESHVRGSNNGLGSEDYKRQRVGGGPAPSLNGASAKTYDKRLWIDKNPYRTLGG